MKGKPRDEFVKYLRSLLRKVVLMLAFSALMMTLIPIRTIQGQEGFGTVTIGEDKTFTACNYHDSWFEDDPIIHMRWPNQREAYSSGNSAHVSETANPGSAGVAVALVGVQFDWDFGAYTWEEVQDWPITIYFSFSYTISAYYVEGTGSASANIGVTGATGQPWYDSIGRLVYTPGTRSRAVTKVYTTTVAGFYGMGGRIFAQLNCQAHSAVNQTNYSYADVTVTSLRVEFAKRNQSPVAAFTFSPADPTVGQQVSFDASPSYDPDGTISKYEWDFGDNSTGTGKTVSHSYSQNGGYSITLSVTDNRGASNSITQSIILGALGDLQLLSIKPVQSIFGTSVMVKDKPTAIQTDIRSTFSVAIKAKIKIVVDSQTNYEDLTIQPMTTETFFLPQGKTTTLLFKRAGIADCSVEVDVYDAIESNETNNFLSETVKVVDTQGFSIAYEFLACPVSPGMALESTEFIRATYPVSPYEIFYSTEARYDIIPDCSTNSSQIELLHKLADIRVFSGKAFVAGVIPKSAMPSGTSGVMNPNIKGAVLVANDYYSATAHEIGHHFNLPVGKEEEYTKTYSGDPARGYWVARRELRDASNTICFMGTATLYGKDRWICDSCYNHLLVELGGNSDPELLYVSGWIFANGTTQLRTWYRIPEGYPDLQPGDIGDYAIACLDADGNKLSQINFNATSQLYSGATTEETGDAAFAFTIPYQTGTAKVLVTHNDMIIGERTVSTHSPTVNVTSPIGGESIVNHKNITITWEAFDLDNDNLIYVVLYSADGGGTWMPLALNIEETSYNWDISGLTPGSDYLVKVIASDGVNSGQNMSSRTFTIPELAGETGISAEIAISILTICTIVIAVVLAALAVKRSKTKPTEIST
jgi:hypothetical protein